MTPTQYRALERLEQAGTVGLPVARSPEVPPTHLHPATVKALHRRGLAEIRLTYGHGDLDVAVISAAGSRHLARSAKIDRPA